MYARYLHLLGKKAVDIHTLTDIPFLPISLFKTHILKTGEWPSGLIFSSSGTTQQSLTSQHHLRDGQWYLQNARRGFENFYGPIKDYCFLALLPAYLERTGSSLVFMADDFIRHSSYSDSGFFLYNIENLLEIIKRCQDNRVPTILLGVSFALLDLAEKHQPSLEGIIAMETGGMKGRGRELTRTELHERLSSAFGIPLIHSEYGMTELLSQAYSQGKGLYYPAATMKVLARELTDPLLSYRSARTGALNIIDLANMDSMAFIATDDLGRVHPDGSFEVMGRMDHSDLRGCNLMLADV